MRVKNPPAAASAKADAPAIPVAPPPAATTTAAAAVTVEDNAASWWSGRTAVAASSGAAAPSSTTSAGPSPMLAAFAARLGDELAAPPSSGTKKAKTRADFEKLAIRDDVPGAAGVLAVKFLVLDVDTDKPKLWLIDTNQHAYHFDFASRGLGMGVDLATFNQQTYFRDARKNVAGTVVVHDAYVDPKTNAQGLYAVEFWPTDPVGARHVNKAFDALAKAMPFAQGKMAYHPAGDTQESLLQRDAGALARMKVPVVTTQDLFAGVTFSALNQGTGYGVLRVIDSARPDPVPPTARDVVVFKGTPPNETSHVAGILTELPQTPLSHLNLKAKQNRTPNAYLKDAAALHADLVGKIVKLTVGPDGVTIAAATQAEADAHFEAKRPVQGQTPARDLTKKTIAALDDLGNADATAYGAKTANLGELRKLLGGHMVPDGFGVPFSFYDDFMKHNGLYDAATAMMQDPAFKSDPKTREDMLKAFRKRVKDAAVPPQLSAQLADVQARFAPDQPIRCRSSTNNEDLEGFNGAGLYDSSTHKPDEGHLENTVKKVWASLWNFRAFEEREFWKIDHLQAAMAVTLHPNMSDERANGVAITRNIYDANWPGFYVNAQVGKSLVTNPNPGETPDEMLVSAIGENSEYEVQMIRRSSLAPAGVLPRDRLLQLVAAMEKIQSHFKKVYGREDDPTFAMDIEFKLDGKGDLIVKQARPVVPDAPADAASAP